MPMRPSHPGYLLLVILLLVVTPQVARGQGWQHSTVPAPPAGSTYQSAAVSALDAQRLWVSGIVHPSYDSFILRSTDGGLTWTQIHRAAGEGAFSDLAMLSNTVGFVAGSGVRRTDDGGVTWQVEQSTIGDAPGYHHGIGPDGWVYGMAVVDDGHIWTAGYDGASAGVIYHRVPERPLPDPNNLNVNRPWWLEWAANYHGMYGISAVNQSVAWSVGYAGWIWKTVDGEHWGQQTSPTGAALYDVVAIDTATAWAVGSGGTIVRTTDGGTTWSVQTSGTTEDLRKIAAPDALNAWVVGAGGTILHTTDGGQTWVRQYSGTRATLLGVVATTPARAWVVGESTIMYTTDGGSGTWPAPTITSVSPVVSGQASSPGLTITIRGTGFRGGNLAVTVGSEPASGVTWIDETTITAIVPSGLLGTFGVTVTNEDGQVVTKPDAVTVIAPPTITRYSPFHGPATGGFVITVDGLGFEAVTSATIHRSADWSTEPATFTKSGSTQLTITVPVSASRPVGRALLSLGTALNQEASISDFHFDPPGGPPLVIDTIAPASGPPGTRVTVTGSGFTADTVLRICWEDALQVTRTATQMSGTVYTTSPGLCDVQVYDAVNEFVVNSGFLATGAKVPVVTGIAPAIGSVDGGTTVTITGTDLADAPGTRVTFGGFPAVTTSRTATQVVVRTPPHAAGAVDVVVMGIDTSGDQITQAAVRIGGFSYGNVPSPPRITDISPAAIDIRGGTILTIVGAHFPTAPAPSGTAMDALEAPPSVTVGGVAATGVTVVNASTITCIAPAVPATTAADVVVTWADGSSAASSASSLALAFMDPAAHAGHDDDADGMPDAFELAFGLDPLDPSDASANPDGDGRTNAQEAAAGTHPLGVATRFLAEGATGSMFQTRVALANPDTSPAHALLRFAKADGSITTQTVLVPATGRATVDVETLAGMSSAEFATTIESDRGLVVDRTLRWSITGHYGSHAERSVPTPATTWYLAEGATHSGFDLFYLLQNPSPTAAEVTVTYLLPVGQPLTKTYVVGGNSRSNIWVNVEQFPDGSGLTPLAATDVSAVVTVTNGVPIIVERAVYLTRGGQFFAAGHESAGVTSPALSWFLAEGNTGRHFDLFVLIANPGTQVAQISADYLLTDGTVITRSYTVEPMSRFNIWVDLEDPRLNDAAVSTTVTSTNGVPIIVERAMWWPGDFSTWAEAHNSPGSTETGTRWGLAEGEVGGADATETYILIANTSTFAGSALVTLLFEDGTTATTTVALLPKSRTNVSVKDEFGQQVADRRFGAVITSQAVGANPAAAIVVERAMYSSADGTWWSAGTNALATKLP